MEIKLGAGTGNNRPAEETAAAAFPAV